MLPAFGVLLLVVIFGNFFCGWFCPMGATIDFFDRFLFREKKRSRDSTTSLSEGSATGSSSSPWLRALMALQVLYLLDPISLITRTLVISFYPPTIFISTI